MPLEWLTNVPVWVDQWPLPDHKQEAARKLVQEQVQLGHLVPSNSPWNTPIFVITKKSGKWRLLQDLRVVNAVMKPMGALQPGLPAPSAIPLNYQLLILDLKDCFFTIPLSPDDCEKFAFQFLLLIYKPLMPGIIGRFCLRAWAIVLPYVRNL